MWAPSTIHSSVNGRPPRSGEELKVAHFATRPLEPRAMSDADTPTKPDYRPTVFLPRTDFPMKAGLPQKEPAILARWQAEDLYGQVRKARAGAPKFIFHDGPPYANGDIHIGHALNRTLK